MPWLNHEIPEKLYPFFDIQVKRQSSTNQLFFQFFSVHTHWITLQPWHGWSHWWEVVQLSFLSTMPQMPDMVKARLAKAGLRQDRHDCIMLYHVVSWGIRIRQLTFGFINLEVLRKKSCDKLSNVARNLWRVVPLRSRLLPAGGLSGSKGRAPDIPSRISRG